MSNDLIRLVMERAARRFGGSDGTFNSAGFGVEFCKAASSTGYGGSIDGKLVRAMLTGRQDVEVLKGGAHFRVVT